MTLEYIAPETLLGLVRNTAPFIVDRFGEAPLSPGARLIDCGDHPLGFLEVLQGSERISNLPEAEQVEDYFAFCLACHHATVATFVPTDVDSKIRGLLWRQTRDRDALRRMFHFTLRAMRWSLQGISTRTTELAQVGPVSGHDGEMLSVLAAALGSFLRVGDEEYAQKASAAIHAELEREAVELRWAMRSKGCELNVHRIAASLTHNVGDLDQGISFWSTGERYAAARERFGRLAHENSKPHDGAYQTAARIYKKAMSAEGHRNYPLRGVKALRQSADLLLPLSPFLDDWGAMVARHPLLAMADRAEVLGALLHGCSTLANQKGYFRAIHGMASVLEGKMDTLVKSLGNKARSDWKSPELRKQISVPRVSFESMMKKLAS